jgi:hypothetical protein
VARPKQPVYLVQQLAWEPDEQRVGHFVRLGLEDGSPVKAFSDRARAEALCAELERDFRSGLNPFRYGRGLDDWTSLPPGLFRDWLLDAGLTPPEVEQGVEEWVRWWDREGGGLSDFQREKVWEAVDGVRFFTVAALGHAPPGRRGGEGLAD